MGLLGHLGSGTISCQPPQVDQANTAINDPAMQQQAQRIGILLDAGLPVHRRHQALTELANQGDAATWPLLRQIAADEKVDRSLRALAQERLQQHATAPQTTAPAPR